MQKHYFLEKKDLFRAITKDIGTLIKKGNQLFCFIDQKDIKSFSKSGKSFLFLNSIDESINYRSIEEYLNLHKKITYIFSNIDFQEDVYLLSMDAPVEFHHCTFLKNFTSMYTHSLLFKNCSFDSFEKESKVIIQGEKIKFQNCYFEKRKVSIREARETTLLKTDIYVQKMDLDSDSIISRDTVILADEKIVLVNPSYDYSRMDNSIHLKSPHVFYNQQEIPSTTYKNIQVETKDISKKSKKKNKK